MTAYGQSEYASRTALLSRRDVRVMTQGILKNMDTGLLTKETLQKKAIVFTTVNPQNRYIRLKNIKPNNNLRSVYYGDIQLGGTPESLYEKTNNMAIEYALKRITRPVDKTEGPAWHIDRD